MLLVLTHQLCQFFILRSVTMNVATVKPACIQLPPLVVFVRRWSQKSIANEFLGPNQVVFVERWYQVCIIN